MSAQGPADPSSPPRVQAGWYPDPHAPGVQRWWDGQAWTQHTTPAGGPGAPAAYCRACGKHIDGRAVMCPHCGVPQSAGAPVLAAVPPAAKAPALCILLSVLLPGVGHIYAGDSSTAAIVLLVLTGVCFVLSLTLILIPLALLIWLPCAIWGAVDSRQKALEYNASRGLVA